MCNYSSRICTAPILPVPSTSKSILFVIPILIGSLFLLYTAASPLSDRDTRAQENNSLHK